MSNESLKSLVYTVMKVYKFLARNCVGYTDEDSEVIMSQTIGIAVCA